MNVDNLSINVLYTANDISYINKTINVSDVKNVSCAQHTSISTSPLITHELPICSVLDSCMCPSDTFPTSPSKVGGCKVVNANCAAKSKIMNTVKGNVLNVDGLEGKLNLGILDCDFSDGDFNVFLETRSDNPNFSNTMLCDYSVFVKQKPKVQSSKYHYGGIHGICVLINNRFCLDSCHVIENTVSECILWVRLKIASFEFILGAVYIPCVSSPFFFDDIWDQIHEDVGHLKQLELPFLLAGDENAHMGTLIDYIENDPYVADFTGCIVLNEEESPEDIFLANPYCTSHRYNQEKINVNTTGRKAISFCITENFKIINGRFGADRFLGRATCFKGQPSVTDHAIACDKMFKRVTDFHVGLFDPNMSDFHAPISVTFDISDSALSSINEDSTESLIDDSEMQNFQNAPNMKFTWNNEIKESFKSAIRKIDVKEFQRKLDELVKCPSQENTNQLCQDLKDNIINVAQSCNAYKDFLPPENTKNHKKRKGPLKKRPPRQPWEDEEFCKVKNDYRAHKNKLIRIGAKRICNKKAKMFKKFGKQKQKEYFDSLNNKIRVLKKNNSREYWLLLQKSIESKRTASKITLQAFLEHFRKLNEAKDKDQNSESISQGDLETNDQTEVLNVDFDLEEIKIIISKLKNGKSPGLDLLKNEFLRNLPDELNVFICNFFNFILNSGFIPDIWCEGLIMPLYKNKGDIKDPDNYRGITLLSCLGKLFTACISDRISKFMDVNYKLGPEQAGFREGFSTTDHIFTLYSIIEFYTNKKGRVYCAFVDYSKAFDLIERSSLWLKLLNNDINGKILNVIKSLYVNAKSCVKLDGKISDYFSCCKGVRQGENLSPVLFAIYLNDFHAFLNEKCFGLKDLCSAIDEELDIYLKLYVLLYADDTIILAESAADLQTALSSLHEYCVHWDLKVNISKTNVVIFSRGKVKKYPIFKIGENIVEVKPEYVYLGVTFSYNGSFQKAIEKQITQARKAMYSLLQKAKILRLPFDIIFELYEQCVIPVLLYGSEVWGFENLTSIEIFHRKFYKLVLKSFKFTPNCMIYGETNSVDIQTKVDIRMANFWLKLKSGKIKISVAMCSLLSKLYEESNDQNIRWPAKIKNILADTELSYLWQVQVADYLYCKEELKTKCYKNFLEKWRGEVRNNSQCEFYNLIKSQPKIENYLTQLSYSLRINTVKFFIRGHHLPVTIDRWNKEGNADRICKKCDQNEVGDENHYIFSCNFFAAQRAKYLPNFARSTDDPKSAWDSILQYKESNLVSLAKFICHITSHFEFDKADRVDKDADWHKIKRAKVSRAGRVLKPNPKYSTAKRFRKK